MPTYRQDHVYDECYSTELTHLTGLMLRFCSCVESPNGNRMRIVKLASRTDALPGEIVEFTLRFDNVGVETVGNVTIIDNLTARLEYVPESSLSTVDAEFFSQLNENGSLVLRWEIAEPLAPGEGGVIRFQCRVR